MYLWQLFFFPELLKYIFTLITTYIYVCPFPPYQQTRTHTHTLMKDEKKRNIFKILKFEQVQTHVGNKYYCIQTVEDKKLEFYISLMLK